MPGLFGQRGNLSLVIDVLASKLEPEAGTLFLLGAVLRLSAHDSTITTNQYHQESTGAYQGVIFFQMIRVHGLLRASQERKDRAAQTDALLPKIGGGLARWRKSGKAGQQTLYDGHSPKMGNTNSWASRQGGHASCITTLCSPSSNKLKMSNKENTSSSSHASSKLQAKAFKFLHFEEELLRGAILKHLSGRQLSRQERIKLRSKTYLSFLRQQACRKEFDEDLAVIEIPEEERVAVSIQELVEGVRQAYLELGVGGKGRDVMMFSLHRRIAQVVGGLLAKGDRPIVDPNPSSSCDGQQLLKNYLKRYVQESERMNHCLSQSKSKDKLMGFYQQIYNRYESIPFSDTPEESPSDHTIQPASMLVDPSSPSLARGKKSRNSEQSSFIKLRFYNNLRKEVMTLSEDTEKIMQEENSKMAHS